MKTLFVRLSVLALALTGFTASTITTQAASKSGNSVPVPMCTPGTGDYCGLH